MENASKALIIAGAILLSIALIGVGMYVYQQAAGAVSEVGMQTEQALAYNSDFEPYLGTNVRGTQVRTLMKNIRNHNNTSDTKINPASGSLTKVDDISNEKTYTVEVPADGYDTVTGYIIKIKITENK